MKIFVLEDSMERIKWFKASCEKQGYELIHTDNVKDALIYLNKDIFDIIFLDHDLDNKVYVESANDNTGWQVARQLHNTINKTSPVVIHSMNYIGANNMFNTIKDNGNNNVNKYVFGTFKI